MDIWLLIALLLMSLFLVVIVVASNRNTNNLVISLVAILASVLVWSQMKQVTPQLSSDDDTSYTATDFQNELQQSLSKILINQTCGLN